jgi:leucyl-tRNA---protein transferase
MSDTQRISHWPAWPLPVLGGEPAQVIAASPAHLCSYFPNRPARFRAFEAASLSADAYQHYMDAGFRRSGRIVYQPVCAGCRRCVPLRVPVARLVMSKSQRRVLRKNSDLQVRAGRPEPSAEKWQLYERYQKQWHDGVQGGDPISFIEFLYQSPVETMEFEYRDGAGRLVGAGICDVSPKSISSVYFYFDPAERKRSLGTFSALYEMLWARELAIPYWYAGYWVDGCATMSYKSRFHPAEILCTDGHWRELQNP